MSKRPTGTSLDEDRLLALRTASESADPALAIEVTTLVEGMTVDPAENPHVDWTIDERDGVPALIFGPLDSSEISKAAYAEQLHTEDDEVLAPIPDRLVTAGPPDGLGLELEAYDDSNPLLFEGLALEDAAAVVPARYGDGTPYTQEPRSNVATESDPVAQETIEHEEDGHPAPNPNTLDAPIDPEIVRDAIREFDAPYPDMSAVLETLHRREIVSEADTVGGYPPLTVDERAVCVVPAGTWTGDLTSRLESDVLTSSPP